MKYFICLLLLLVNFMALGFDEYDIYSFVSNAKNETSASKGIKKIILQDTLKDVDGIDPSYDDDLPQPLEVYQYLSKGKDFFDIVDSNSTGFQLNFLEETFCFSYAMQFVFSEHKIEINLKNARFLGENNDAVSDSVVEQLTDNIFYKILELKYLVKPKILNRLRSLIPETYFSAHYIRCKYNPVLIARDILENGKYTEDCYEERTIDSLDLALFFDDFFSNRSINLAYKYCTFLPHDGIVFKDEKGTIIFCMEICYDCKEVSMKNYLTNSSKYFSFIINPSPRSFLQKEMNQNNNY